MDLSGPGIDVKLKERKKERGRVHLQLASEFNSKDLELQAIGVNVPRSYLKN